MKPKQLEAFRNDFNDQHRTYGHVSTYVPFAFSHLPIEDFAFITIQTRDIGLTLSRLADMQLLEGYVQTPMEPGMPVLTQRYVTSLTTQAGEIRHYITFEDVGLRAVDE